MYPALSVLQAIGNQAEAVLWVGGQSGMEAELIRRQGIPYAEIPAAGVHGVGLARLPGNLLKLAQGVAASRRILADFKPDVLFFTGGFVAAPMAVAGGRIPSVLYVPDIEPGLALRFLARSASKIAVSAETSSAYFKKPEKVIVTGYPIRAGLTRWTRAESLKHFGFSADKPVLLVFGGSKGARSINRAVLQILPRLLDKYQVLHVSGSLDWAEVDAASHALNPAQSAAYRAFPYLHEDMGAAFACSDLVVCRAGASSLGELPAFGLPAILVPYPYAWRYQKVNADYLVSHQAAVLLKDEDLGTHLHGTIVDLLADAEKLDAMKQAMRSLARPQAAAEIARIILAAGGQPLEKGADPS